MKKPRAQVAYLIEVYIYVLGRRNENSVASSEVHLARIYTFLGTQRVKKNHAYTTTKNNISYSIMVLMQARLLIFIVLSRYGLALNIA